MINIKHTLWSMLELIGSVTRTRVLSCQMLLNSCWANDWQSNWLHRILSFFFLTSGCVYFTALFSTLELCFGCGDVSFSFPFSVYLCMSYWVFLLNSVFHHWSMFYHCFILTIGKLPNHFFPVNSGPLRVTGCKKALKCCPQFTPLGSSLPGPGSIYL